MKSANAHQMLEQQSVLRVRSSGLRGNNNLRRVYAAKSNLISGKSNLLRPKTLPLSHAHDVRPDPLVDTPPEYEYTCLYIERIWNMWNTYSACM